MAAAASQVTKYPGDNPDDRKSECGLPANHT
jgi:hypothetical protein